MPRLSWHLRAAWEAGIHTEPELAERGPEARGALSQPRFWARSLALGWGLSEKGTQFWEEGRDHKTTSTEE